MNEMTQHEMTPMRATTILAVRRGSDVVKAVAAGADAVLAGRAPLYGLAAFGEPGVVRALELLRAETARSMAMLGARTTAEARADFAG